MEDHTFLLEEFNFTNLVQASTKGFSGGMIILWHGTNILIVPIIITTHEITAFIQVSPTSPSWILTLIYTSTKFTIRQDLWNNFYLFLNNIIY